MNNRSRYIELCGLVFWSIVIWWQPIATSFKLAFTSEAHTHIVLIVPLSLALIYLERKRMPTIFESSRRVGTIVMITALLLRGTTLWHLFFADALSVSMFALVTWWIGSVIFCLGAETFRAFLFPLCFLVLIIPFPERLLNWITEFLQHQSVLGTALLFRLARVPMTRDGVILSIPGLDIEVARSCSGIRSSMMLIVTTLVLSRLFLRSWWSRALLVVAAMPLSIAKNAARIFTIAELGTRVDPGFLYGRLHRNGGVLFFSLAVIAVVVLLWIVRKRERLNFLVCSPGKS